MTSALLGQSDASAESLVLGDPDVPIHTHMKQPSKVKLRATTTFDEMLSGFGLPTGGKIPGSTELGTISMDFDVYLDRLPNGAGTTDAKPACQKSVVRRIPVSMDSIELQYFDMVFYDYRDSAEAARAAAWPRPTVPYLEGDLYNPYRSDSRQQELARFFQVRCLPTRFHYPLVNGVRYEEYREGGKAWERDPE